MRFPARTVAIRCQDDGYARFVHAHQVACLHLVSFTRILRCAFCNHGTHLTCRVLREGLGVERQIVCCSGAAIREIGHQERVGPCGK